MTALEIITAAQRRTNKLDGSSATQSRFFDHLNFARRKAWNRFNWSWKLKTWNITTSSQIITGTGNFNNGSQSITLSGAPSVSSTQIGWYIQALGSSPLAWYRVINVPSSTTLTISPAYQGSSNSAASFYLRAFDYAIPSELEGMPKIVETTNTHLTLQSMMTRPTLLPDSTGKPSRGVIWGDDPIGTTYTTGTITGTINTRVWTGSGTAWLANVTIGDQLEIVVGSTTYKYHIQSVQTDTSLTTYQYANTSPAASTYTIRNQFNRYIRVYPSSDNYNYPLSIYGTRRFFPIANNNDIDELMQNYDESLVEGVEAYEMASSPDDRENAKYNRWLVGISEKMAIDSRNMFVKNPEPILIPWGNYRD